MKDAFLVFWNALKDTWDGLLLLVLTNVATVLLIIPVVTSAPALGALWYVAHRVAKGRSTSLGDYFGAFRRYFWKAWGVALIAIVGFVLVFANLWFYTAATGPIDLASTVTLGIRVFWIVVGFLWLIFQMYPLALLFEQEDQRLRTALRNAGVLLITRPSFSLVLALLLVVVGLVMGLLLPLWFLVLLAFFAVVCNEAVQYQLQPYRQETETGSPGSRMVLVCWAQLQRRGGRPHGLIDGSLLTASDGRQDVAVNLHACGPLEGTCARISWAGTSCVGLSLRRMARTLSS